jgi:3-phosphoshikimate 1-carboxyvinyltransferase
MRMLGAEINVKNSSVIINGKGKEHLKAPVSPVYLGNSGTSMRLLSGIFASLKEKSVLYGDDSLNKRPMKRIMKPIGMMGGNIKSITESSTPPLVIKGGVLKGIDYKMDVASAQVKSSILLASLFAEGETNITEMAKTRDHTERMLNYLGCSISSNNNVISMKCGQKLYGNNITVPGDISSAAFPIAAALLTPNSKLIIRNIGFNPARIGFIEAIKNMGADIKVLSQWESNNEPFADIMVRSSELKGIEIAGDIIPKLIDEIPVIALLAGFSTGTTVIKDASELRYKESDRINAIACNLRKIGAEVIETKDGMIINPCRIDRNTTRVLDSFNDHRIAMAFSIAGFILGDTTVRNCENIITSFPGFLKLMSSLGCNIKVL